MQRFNFGLFIVTGITFSTSALATQVVYIQGNGSSSPEVLSQGDSPSLCQGRDRPAALDRVRRVVGVPSCDSESSGGGLSDDIGLLVLIDDRRGIGDSLQERLDGLVSHYLTCEARSRQRVFPSFVDLDDESGQLHILVVGAAMLESYFSGTGGELSAD